MGIKEKLSGVFPPCMTPFDENEEVSYAGISRNIAVYNETPVVGLMPLGSNGEFRSLDDEESLKIVELYVKERKPGKTIMAGAGRESAKTTIDFIKKVADLGVDCVSLLPPHYFAKQMTADALEKFFTVVADNSPVPVLLYNAPKFASGVLLSPELITKLAQHPKIVGMKDTSKEDISVYVNAVPQNAEFYVLAGSINKFYAGLTVGAVGGVLSLANYLPSLACELHELHLAGKTAEAEKKDVYLRELSSNAAGKYSVAGVKAAMDLLGMDGGNPRLPFPPLTTEQRAELKRVLEQEKLL